MVFEQYKPTCSEDVIVAKAQYIGNILYVKGNEVESEFYVAVMTILKPFITLFNGSHRTSFLTMFCRRF